MTPAPTPIPTTDQATFRTLAWNGGTVKALCDIYGRIYILADSTSEAKSGIAWTDEGIDMTFDNLDQHEQDFTELIHTYGYNDGVTNIGPDSCIVTINGEAVDFNFEDGQLVPVTSAWQQGETPMFFYRTVNDGTSDVTVVCGPDGKLWVTDNDAYLIKNQNGFAWAVSTASQQLITACGGKAAMDFAAQDEDETTVLGMDDNVVVIDLDGQVTVGAISKWPLEPIEVQGRVQIFKDENCREYADGQSNVVWARVNVNIGVNGGFTIGSPADPGKCLVVHAPTTSEPSEPYNVQVWVDFGSEDMQSSITAGSVIRVEQTAQYFIPVDNPQVIFN